MFVYFLMHTWHALSLVLPLSPSHTELKTNYRPSAAQIVYFLLRSATTSVNLVFVGNQLAMSRTTDRLSNIQKQTAMSRPSVADHWRPVAMNRPSVADHWRPVAMNRPSVADHWRPVAMNRPSVSDHWRPVVTIFESPVVAGGCPCSIDNLSAIETDRRLPTTARRPLKTRCRSPATGRRPS